MRRSAFILALIALPASGGQLLARPAAALAPALPDTLMTVSLPPALPGAVITTTVDIPRKGRGHGVARYVIEPAARVRLFGANTGSFGASVPDRLPLTFTLPRDQEAGPLLIATVTVLWSDGTAFTTELQLHVQPVRRIRLSLSGDNRVTPGKPLTLRYTVANLGNATDIVNVRIRLPDGWKSSRTPPVLLVPQADSMAGAFVLTMPRNIPDGNYSATIVAAGTADTALVTATLALGRDRSTSAWVPLPGTLFIGAPRADEIGATPDVALRAEGTVAPGTRLTLALRHESRDIKPPAFYRYNSGPEYLAALERPEFAAAAGDIYVPGSDAVGSYGFGTGAETSWRGSTHGQLYVARPREIGNPMLPGHLARGAFALPSSLGDFGVRMSDYERPLGLGLPVNRVQSATFAFESSPAHRTHSLSVEAGGARLTADTASQAGPVYRLTYGYRSGLKYLVARTSRVPAVVPGMVGSNEDQLSAGLPLSGSIQAVGSVASASVPYLNMEPSSRSNASLGLVLRQGGTAVHVRGEYDRNSTPSPIFGGTWVQRDIAAAATVPFGHFGLDGYGNLGRIEVEGVNRPFRAVTARATWTAPVGNAWIGADYTEGRFGALPLSLGAGTSINARGFGLEAGGSAYMPAGRDPYLGHIWGAATIPLIGGTAAVTGAEYQPWQPIGSRVRYSFGLRTAVALPVPVPLPPAASGFLFEDRNGDGRRDGDEPPVPGVGLQLGQARTTSGHDGRFAFARRGADNAGLSVDLSTLPMGWLTEAPPQRGRNVAIPLVRAGSLRIRLVASDGPEGADSSRAPVPDIGIELTDARGRQRSAESDERGVVYFAALAPGKYTLTAYPVSARGQGLAPVSVAVEVLFGKPVEVTLPVPTLPLQIRFKSPAPPGSR